MRRDAQASKGGLVHLIRRSDLFRVAALTLLLAGCGQSPSAQGSELFGPNGGSLQLVEGARIDIPIGALTTDVRITVSSGEPSRDLPTGMHAVGPMVTFGPDGQRFATPVRIRIPAQREPAVLYTRPSSGGTWSIVVGATWDASTRMISAEVMHFSDFVPAAREEILDDAGMIDCSDPRWTREPECASDAGSSDCDIFTGSCPADYSCAPRYRDSTLGYCIWLDPSVTTLGRGDECGAGTRDQCGPELICSAETESGTGLCASYCDDAHACGEGEECHHPSDFVWGYCRPVTIVPPTPCNVITQERCDAPNSCVFRSDSGGAAAESVCVSPGAGTRGSACSSSGGCARGLVCAVIFGASPDNAVYTWTVDDLSFTRGGGVCTQPCVAGGCGTGETCQPIYAAGMPIGAGICWTPYEG
jgi:hypothetical protein